MIEDDKESGHATLFNNNDNSEKSVWTVWNVSFILSYVRKKFTELKQTIILKMFSSMGFHNMFLN